MIKKWSNIRGNNKEEKGMLKLANSLWDVWVEEYFKNNKEFVSEILDSYEVNKLRNLILERIPIAPVECLKKFKIAHIGFSSVRNNQFNVVLQFSIPSLDQQLVFKYINDNVKFQEYHLCTDHYSEQKILYPEDVEAMEILLIIFVKKLALYIEGMICCEVVSSKEVALDFPELYEKFHRGKPLSEGYYIRLSSDELFEEGSVIDSYIDNIIGEKGFYNRIALRHGAIKDDRDYYFINKWDADQAIIEIRNELNKVNVDSYQLSF